MQLNGERESCTGLKTTDIPGSMDRAANRVPSLSVFPRNTAKQVYGTLPVNPCETAKCMTNPSTTSTGQILATTRPNEKTESMNFVGKYTSRIDGSDGGVGNISYCFFSDRDLECACPPLHRMNSLSHRNFPFSKFVTAGLSVGEIEPCPLSYRITVPQKTEESD